MTPDETPECESLKEIPDGEHHAKGNVRVKRT